MESQSNKYFKITLFVFINVILISGCSKKSKYAPVSGAVYLDGKPYHFAWVSFRPILKDEDQQAGLNSLGMTDIHGKFSLKSSGQKQGALIGKHLVRIYTQIENGKEDPIPASWRSLNIEHTFEVPAGGTTEANFEVTSTVKK